MTASGFIDRRRFARDEICHVFRVPADQVQPLEAAHFATRPILEALECEVHLLPRSAFHQLALPDPASTPGDARADRSATAENATPGQGRRS